MSPFKQNVTSSMGILGINMTGIQRVYKKFDALFLFPKLFYWGNGRKYEDARQSRRFVKKKKFSHPATFFLHLRCK